MKKRIIIAHLLLSVLWLASCVEKKTSEEVPNEKEAHATKAENHEAQHQNTNTAILTEMQMKSIGVELGLIEQKELTASLKANGTLRVPNQNRANINTLYAGVVQSIRVQPGDAVRKGQIIASVINPDFMKPQEEYLALIARLELAQVEYDRQKELSQNNAGALKNFQTANTELQTLITRKNTLCQQIRLMGINPTELNSGKLISTLTVKSPISGVVSSVSAELGSYVDLTTPIAEIVDNSQLHLDLFVFEKDLPKLRENQLIHFTLTNAPGREFDAQIFSLGSSFEGESKAVSVHAKVLDKKTGLIDGMNITAIVSLEKAKVPAVPTEAIVSYQGQDFVFMVSGLPSEETLSHKPGREDTAQSVTFEKVPVAKGTTDIGYTEITLLKPVPLNTRIVVKGAFFVLAKMTNSGDEHAH
ncbi:Cobalt-zinc-cadmium resistance protein CzcB [Dyadobacter sp. CECT 9275]|uniref:Cobalt-zinc-cadmium resistance protein CzcB n=1 Tax=Dyadobacter helix TaxID=2822344 RepID=A0A916JFY2_9BACT|nr:efflux RND transporter periplasmic adaptor subunit [Dyadobacter sp. CECT 9275]CAG5001024.1 Cobalt-zinc-cadmium resistance protein CzcB [Dyadobacter sp. CECT 9275]